MGGLVGVFRGVLGVWLGVWLWVVGEAESWRVIVGGDA